LESVDQLVKMLADAPSDYSYFDHNLISAWAGPNHWHIRPFTKGKFNVQQNEEKKRAKKPPLRLNYDEEKNFDELFATSKKPMKLVKKTLQQWDKEKTTLPEDLHYDIKKLMKLFSKPDVSLSSKLRNADGERKSELAFDPDNVPSPSKDWGLDNENDMH
ncbi:condensin complex subunit 2-like, partial [Limulus polyphemus]|uniref:Condensin complex subunit 2 n=1 Tax=Limulus polyphemus TaxID=6850 RepID=A0ABM1C3H4_LIMPO